MPEHQDDEKPESEARPAGHVEPVSEGESAAETSETVSEPEVVASHPRRPRTRVDEMGIPPLWAVGGDKGKTKELRKQLGAAEEALERARADARDANERYLRTAAEMENLRRRHQKDRTDQLLYGNSDLIVRILPLLDNFHRALDHVPASAEDDVEVRQWVSGLLMVVRQFEDILEGAGVEAIDAVGRAFDPSLHQAVMAEASDEHEDGQVIAELQRGYRLRDRVLRPSMVKVANNQ
ncbi:MAG TPA: nucleotide exchange factor GrpE [Candidatus Dormibacteraeota bacterium]|nr:nucleotide exchange factor GrpE [Candidatus Dormibacteraeota bacterium]